MNSRSVLLFVLLTALLIYAAPALAQDTDGDGLSDIDENTFWHTDPQDADTDNDSINDYLETLFAYDPLDADTDDDGISDGNEDVDQDGVQDTSETNPKINDTDGDGLGDGQELGVSVGIPTGLSDGTGIPYLGTAPSAILDSDPGTMSDPLDMDSDEDGIYDGDEDADRDGFRDLFETDPMDADTDDDGIADGFEITYIGTSPLDADYDGDGLSDGLEVGADSPVPSGTTAAFYFPYLGTAPGFTPDADNSTTTDPIDDDSDDDGLSDGDEDTGHNGAIDYGETDPNDYDSDDDGLGDGLEAEAIGTDPLDPDSDNDGLTDYEETDGGFPIDTDDDGIIDALDTDSDDDGYLDSDPLEGLNDDDGDGTPNYRDPDSPATDTDGDGLDDPTEAMLGTDPDLTDSDADGIGDFVETDGGSAIDTDNDGTIDALDTDSDDDGVLDETEGVVDSDADMTPDYRDPDDDGDTIPTLTEGTDDVDSDGLPNYLDADSDNDTFSDSEEAAVGSDPYDPESTPLNIFNPAITTITDVGNDQGRRVRLTWQPSLLDVSESATPVYSYSLYRRVDAAKQGGDFIVHTTAPGVWDYVMNLPATGEVQYQTLAETLCDSTEAGVSWSVFFVRAHTAVPTSFYDSPPDSGYSIDNLAPAAPEGFSVAYGPGNLLTWDPCEDADFDYFRIYRSDVAEFTPDETALAHTTTSVDWSDAAGGFGDHYLISAVDFSGNESPVSAPSDISGIDRLPVFIDALQQNTPNPFNPRTTIAFNLAQADKVHLSVYDVSGRLIKSLITGEDRNAGAHSMDWNGRDSQGRQVSAGVYFYSVRTTTFTETRRMTLVK